MNLEMKLKKKKNNVELYILHRHMGCINTESLTKHLPVFHGIALFLIGLVVPLRPWLVVEI